MDLWDWKLAATLIVLGIYLVAKAMCGAAKMADDAMDRMHRWPEPNQTDTAMDL